MGPLHGFLEYYMSSQWAVFHVHILSQGQGQLHVKPNGLLSNSNVGTAFEDSRCLLYLTKTYIEYIFLKNLNNNIYVVFFKSNHMFEDPMISGFSNITCYNASTFCFLFVLLAIIF